MHSSRSFLFVPGDRPERFVRACVAHAHAVVLDLEDAVAPASKVLAREAVRHWLDTGPRCANALWVRINACGTAWFDDDVALAAHPRVAGVLLPKAEDDAPLHAIAARLNANQGLMPLIETVKGHARLGAIAAAPHVVRLVFGSADFMADAGLDGDGAVLDPIRLQLVLASRLAGIAAPVDGATLAARDADEVLRDAQRARSLGMGGKLCIHPAQVEAVHAAFAATLEQMAWARAVVDALQAQGRGAALVEGRLVDRAMLARARMLLAHRTAQPGESAWAC